VFVQESSHVGAEFVNDLLWQRPFPFVEKFVDQNTHVMLPTKSLVYLNLSIAMSKPERLVTPELAFLDDYGLVAHSSSLTDCTIADVTPLKFLAMALLALPG